MPVSCGGPVVSLLEFNQSRVQSGSPSARRSPPARWRCRRSRSSLNSLRLRGFDARRPVHSGRCTGTRHATTTLGLIRATWPARSPTRRDHRPVRRHGRDGPRQQREVPDLLRDRPHPVLDRRHRRADRARDRGRREPDPRRGPDHLPRAGVPRRDRDRRDAGHAASAARRSRSSTGSWRRRGRRAAAGRGQRLDPGPLRLRDEPPGRAVAGARRRDRGVRGPAHRAEAGAGPPMARTRGHEPSIGTRPCRAGRRRADEQATTVTGTASAAGGRAAPRGARGARDRHRRRRGSPGCAPFTTFDSRRAPRSWSSGLRRVEDQRVTQSWRRQLLQPAATRPIGTAVADVRDRDRVADDQGRARRAHPAPGSGRADRPRPRIAALRSRARSRRRAPDRRERLQGRAPRRAGRWPGRRRRRPPGGPPIPSADGEDRLGVRGTDPRCRSGRDRPSSGRRTRRRPMARPAPPGRQASSAGRSPPRSGRRTRSR